MTGKTKADLLVHGGWVVPVVPTGAVLEGHAVAVKDGRILELAPSDQARDRIDAGRTVELPGHALLPGLVNAHGHCPMVLFRGVADDLPLKQWLYDNIWPLEKEWVNREFVRQGAALAVAEMIASGTTCFADNYFFPDEVAKVAVEAGIRVQLACPLMNFGTSWARSPKEYIRKATALHDEYRGSDLVFSAFGPHAPYTVSDASLKEVAKLAREIDIPVHIHLHETAGEIDDALKTDGRRPWRRLMDLGVVGPRLVSVHATQLTDEEIEAMARHNVSVVHCPESNLKLASGFCEVAKLLDAGVNVALGTDGGASNNDLDMFGEMRTAALLAKAVADDPTAAPAHAVLEMATINGARALGVEDRIGSLEPGKLADFIAVDFDAFNTLPVNSPLSHLVYAAAAGQVTHAWRGGEPLLAERALATLNAQRIRQSAAGWRRRLART